VVRSRGGREDGDRQAGGIVASNEIDGADLPQKRGTDVGRALPDSKEVGHEVAATLRQANAMQEHLRFTERKAAVQRMRHEAVAVYRAVLDVNHRAAGVYAADRKKAEPFNLRILKRRSSRRTSLLREGRPSPHEMNATPRGVHGAGRGRPSPGTRASPVASNTA